jgi:hypothetical protein
VQEPYRTRGLDAPPRLRDAALPPTTTIEENMKRLRFAGPALVAVALVLSG